MMVLWCNGSTSSFGVGSPSSNLGRITMLVYKSCRDDRVVEGGGLENR